MGCGAGSAGDLSLLALLAAGLGLRLRRRFRAPRAG
jgi:MYXO-CTERM domain-containing protein